MKRGEKRMISKSCMKNINHMKAKKRWLLLMMMSLLVLTSCSEDSSNVYDQLTIVEEQETEDKITLDVWHLWITEDDGNSIAFAKALEAYEELHPEVEIRIDSTENEAYKTKLRTAFSSNEAPDVFFTWGSGFARPLVEAGLVSEITEYLEEEALSNINEDELTNFTFDDKLYGLPYISWLGILYCNAELFEAYDVQIPRTMDQLFLAIDSFRDEDIVPMSVGAKDTWAAMFYHNIATVRTAGVEEVKEALDGKRPFDDQPFQDGAQLVTELIERGAFDENSLAFTYDESKVAFLSGQVPMMYTGSWLAAEIKNPDLSSISGKVIGMNFPAIDGGLYNDQFLGGAIDGLMVSESCENKEVAAEFVAFMAEKMSKESYLEGSGIPIWNVDTHDEEVSPLVQDILQLADNADEDIVAWDTYLTADDVNKYLDLIQELFEGNLSPKAFTENMNSILGDR